MTRLLHAAARGARVQAKFDEWETEKFVMVLDLQDPRYDYRIHLEDEHLQYGPISSALREAAVNPPEDIDDAMPITLPFVLNFNYRTWRESLCASKLHRSLFLLLVAESLADEGM